MVNKNLPDFDVATKENKLKELTDIVVKHAKKCGADASEVSASYSTGISASVRMKSIESLEFNQNQGFGITVYFGKKKGTATSSDVSENMLKQTVEAACNIAKYTQEDIYNGLAESNEMATFFPNLNLYHPWNIDAKQAIDIALNCEEAGFQQHKNITNSEGASVSTHQGCSIYRNSHGFIGKNTSSMHNISCALVGKNENDMQRDYWYSISRDPLMLENPKLIGQKAAQRTIDRLNAKKIKTGSTPIVLQANLASGFIGHFLAAINGGALYRDASFLKNSLGKKVFPDWIQIQEDPYIPMGLASCSFDSDGLQTRKKSFIENGVVSNYLLGTYSARRLNMKSTANSGGVSNVIVDNNAGELDEILSYMDKGFLITEFIGSSLNLVTGDYSRGACGFWIENGKIAYPVSEVTVAGNLKDMFNGIVKIGNDYDDRYSIKSGSILIDNVMIAGE